jgi:hypothetical protein
MLNDDRTASKVNVFYLKAQSFTNAAPKMEEQPDKQSIPEVVS